MTWWRAYDPKWQPLLGHVNTVWNVGSKWMPIRIAKLEVSTDSKWNHHQDGGCPMNKPNTKLRISSINESESCPNPQPAVWSILEPICKQIFNQTYWKDMCDEWNDSVDTVSVLFPVLKGKDRALERANDDKYCSKQWTPGPGNFSEYKMNESLHILWLLKKVIDSQKLP